LLIAVAQYLLPNEVIPLLPAEIHIQTMASYLESSLRHNQHKKCMGQIEKQIRRAEMFEQRIEYQRLTSRSKEIDVGKLLLLLSVVLLSLSASCVCVCVRACVCVAVCVRMCVLSECRCRPPRTLDSPLIH
jgi:hypothetical protein